MDAVQVGRAWKLMCTSKRYAWPNFKASKVQCEEMRRPKAWNDDDDVLDVFGLDSRYERFRNHVFGFRIRMGLADGPS
ncbi:hypothetical protein Tco_0705175 [Tanacetum coccineum]|uniref:Uncharacterized protein n=1 Tax=Tanacetum coccineum TaxID=301880 RepID=A0ABQ4Y419_9ASTR